MNSSFRSFVVILALGLVASVASAVTLAAPSVFPQDVKMKVNFKDQEITSMIESFAKASQKTFVVDPGVRGKISVFASGEVGLDEAFDLLSTGLALNGFAIVEREGRYVVMASRNAQRSSIPTLTEITSVKPERYVTLIVNLKHISAEEANKRLRVLPSKDGEMTPYEPTNSLLITDYISNVNRIAELLKQMDQPISPAVAQIVKDTQKRYEKRAMSRAAKADGDAKAPATTK
jgi:type II secretory pathway component GspD/PulD (secretin)